MAVSRRTAQGLDVGEDVLDEERADGDEAGEGVQLAPEEGVAGVGAERLDATHGRVRGAGGADVAMGAAPVDACQLNAHKLIVSVRTIWRQTIISRADEGVKSGVGG